MSRLDDASPEFQRLLSTVCDEIATQEELLALERIAGDEAALRLVIDYVQLDAGLHRLIRGQSNAEKCLDILKLGPASRTPQTERGAGAAIVPSPLVGLVDSSWPRTVGYFHVGGMPFSYLVGAVICAVGLWITSLITVSHSVQRLVREPALPARDLPDRERLPVGRITGMADCRWAGTAPDAFDHDDVPLGHKYALTSGLLEITYDTGATVILQGPANYEVESTSGGYLSRGKLTVRVEKKGSRVGDQGLDTDVGSAVQLPNQLEGTGAKGERTANPTLAQGESAPTASLAPRPSSLAATGSRPPTLDSRLFSVRTPTVVVSDLGTEFGVEVDRSGISRAHVFQGKVEVRPADGIGFPSPPGRGAGGMGGDAGGAGYSHVVQLGTNESMRVEIGPDRVAKIIRETGQSTPPAFVRQLSRPASGPVRIHAFPTGAGLKVGDADPHWQVVAAGNNPNFKPHPAVVTAAGPDCPDYPLNDLGRSQWVSAGTVPAGAPKGATYTFQTTFEVRGKPQRANVDLMRGAFVAGKHVRATYTFRSIVEFNDKLQGPNVNFLRGVFLAGKQMTAIRLNGMKLPLPDPASVCRLSAGNSCVEGMNRLEIDVASGEPSPAAGAGQVQLRAFLHGIDNFIEGPVRAEE
jgi:hypothetical protein